MNPKERYYSGVARETIHRITANRENWTSFLATMARNYDFTYPEQVMIMRSVPMLHCANLMRNGTQTSIGAM